MGINAPKGISVPDGTLIFGMKVKDKEVWNDIKLGKQKGFSIEGMFEYFDSQINSEYDKDTEDILDMLDIYTMLTVKKSFTTI